MVVGSGTEERAGWCRVLHAQSARGRNTIALRCTLTAQDALVSSSIPTEYTDAQLIGTTPENNSLRSRSRGIRVLLERDGDQHSTRA